MARIFQHEIDHLDGVLFVDRAVKLYQPDEIEEGNAV
jgi:peptide deformylase